jgi:hypothetical protein
MVTPAVAVALASLTHPHLLQPLLPRTSSRLDTYWTHNWNSTNTNTNISNINNKNTTRINNSNYN